MIDSDIYAIAAMVAAVWCWTALDRIGRAADRISDDLRQLRELAERGRR